jgi:predicted amidophosphoribosyltransferase
LVGEAVLRAKSYDGRIGSIGDAQRVARASATWLSKWFNGGRVERPVAIVAVPPKPERRGLSLPAVLADVIGRDLGLPVVAPLCWLGGTAQAKHLPVDERQRALSSMLRVVAPCPPGTILVVDDVFQTGATISALARELGKIGASRVVAFAPSRARVPRRSRGR